MLREPEPEYMDLPEEAAAYEAADFSEVNQAFVTRLLELAGDCLRVRAADLGTGPGDIPARVARACPWWRVVGVDAAWPMLRFARRACAAPAAAWPGFVLADAKRLPFPDAVFDGIFSNSILHHVADTEAFWGELKRIARPGAWVLVRDLTRPGSREAARAIVAAYAANEKPLLQEEFFRSLLASYTVEEVRGQLKAAGLGVIEVRQVSDRHLDACGRLDE